MVDIILSLAAIDISHLAPHREEGILIYVV